MTRNQDKDFKWFQSNREEIYNHIDKIYDDFKKEPMVEQLNNECIRLRQEIEDIKNRSCENCRYCDYVEERLIHCLYFEELLPKEIGKCDKWESKE